MTKKFKNKYRIPSIRAQWWDYGSNAAYFITICTKNKKEYFGKIINRKMNLSPIGEMAHQIYNEIPNQFPYIIIDEFIAMPDHLHAIIIINKSVHPRFIADQNKQFIEDEEKQFIVNHQNPFIEDDSPLIANQEKKGGITGNKNPMLHENLSRVIRWYKGRMTFECRKINSDFQWQSLFYDNIIRNENSYWMIRQYIIDNPKNWKIKQ